MSKFRTRLLLGELKMRDRMRRLEGRTAVAVLRQQKGDMYISDVMRIIIAISLGILLITALIFLFKSKLIPGLSEAIDKLFNYQNGSLT